MYIGSIFGWDDWIALYTPKRENASKILLIILLSLVHCIADTN